MHHFANTVIWVYIVLLLIGGLIGFFKGKSKVSLVTSAMFAAVLILAQTGIFEPTMTRQLVDVIMALLLVVFAIRLAKTRKFMPSGLMLVATVLALALQNIR